MSKLEFHIMIKLWNCILSEFHKVSKSLQDPEISLATCATLYSSLSAFIDSLKKILEIMFPMLTIEVHLKGQEKEKDILMNFLILQSPKEQLSPQDTFQLKSFNPILEALELNISKRTEVYTFIGQMFSFLLI